MTSNCCNAQLICNFDGTNVRCFECNEPVAKTATYHTYKDLEPLDLSRTDNLLEDPLYFAAYTGDYSRIINTTTVKLDKPKP